MKKSFVVIIPLYKMKINIYEKMSIYNTIDKFYEMSDIFYICAKDFDLKEFYKTNGFEDKYKINYIYYDNKYFESIQGYNSLLLNIEFYNYFVNEYKYMLIIQTDAYIFNQYKINYFIEKEYNFIGAPIILQDYINLFHVFKRGLYYNGGLSLRNIKFCIECLQNDKFMINYIENNKCQDEDLIFSSYEQEFYKSPTYIESIKFSIDNQIYIYLPIINFEQPFGVHHFFNDDDNGLNKLEILKTFKWINIEEKNTITT